jgi:hypothetical protein
LPLEGQKPEESPIKFAYSGFVSLEHERSRGFIFNDHIAAFQVLYKTDLSQSYFRMGSTVKYEGISQLAAEGSYIHHFSNTKLAGHNNQTRGYLMDAKARYTWPTGLETTLEGILTSGSSGSVDTGTGSQIIAKKHNFVSPFGNSYLLSIATSDGADDAPGSPKQSILANLSLNEGLKMLVASANYAFTKKLSGYYRYGLIRSKEDSSTTRSNDYGQEHDAGLVYQVNSSSLVQVDYGRFLPGAFFSARTFAELFAMKYKFSF